MLRKRGALRANRRRCGRRRGAIALKTKNAGLVDKEGPPAALRALGIRVAGECRWIAAASRNNVHREVVPLFDPAGQRLIDVPRHPRCPVRILKLGQRAIVADTVRIRVLVTPKLICAEDSVRNELMAEASFAEIRARSRLGMAMAAMIAMMDTTIISSISVNPALILILPTSPFNTFDQLTLLFL